MDIKKFPFLQEKKKDIAVILGQLLDNLQPMLDGPPLSDGIPLWVLMMQNSSKFINIYSMQTSNLLVCKCTLSASIQAMFYFESCRTFFKNKFVPQDMPSCLLKEQAGILNATTFVLYVTITSLVL